MSSSQSRSRSPQYASRRATTPEQSLTRRRLYEAIENEEIATVDQILNQFPQIRQILNERLSPFCEMTALHLAVGLNSVQIAKLLLDNGSDPNNLNCYEKSSPLHLAVMYAYDDMVNLMISAGGNPYLVDGDENSCFDLINNEPEQLSHMRELIEIERVEDKAIASKVKINQLHSNQISQEKAQDRSHVLNGTEESYMTCQSTIASSSESAPLSLNPVHVPDITRRARPSLRVFFEEKHQRRKTLARIDEKQVQQLATDLAYLMTEDESTSNSTSTTTTTSATTPPTATSLCSSSASPATSISPTQTLSESKSHPPEEPVAVLHRKPALAVTVATVPPSPRQNSRIVKRCKSPPAVKNTKKYPLPAMTLMRSKSVKTIKETNKLLEKDVSQLPGTTATANDHNAGSNNFTMELQAALLNLDLINTWANHKVDFVQALSDNGTPIMKRACKSYFNYLLLDPKIIKRSNFSGTHLKSDIIKSSEKFQQFLKAIFYVGKGCGNRPLKHLVDAKAKLLNHRKLSASEKLDRILQIWKSGQGIIIHSIFHHSTEKEANVNEAAILDALGFAFNTKEQVGIEITNMKKGSYGGTVAAGWTQKVKNQFGSFLLYRCFCSFVVSDGGRLFYPADV